MKIAWILPVLNLGAFFACIFFGKRLTPGRAQIWTLAAAIPSWVIAVVAFGQNALGHEAVAQSHTWLNFGTGDVRIGVNIDGFATMMMVVVTTISLMVQIYSIGYMKGEVRYTQFFATLSLFTASMLTLVEADSLLLGLFGWEGMGLCSYVLIGHYFEEKENGNAAIKAFLTTRVGDVGLMFGIFACFWAVGTFDIQEINNAAIEGHFSGFMLEAAAVLLFCGVIGKSAQFPLHTWLPDAMAGPTPVSALIHAATMVVAGVYLVGRMYGVFAEAFDIGETTFHLVAAIGAITALVAALLALVQTDIKKVLAYSTISQLGYMIMALGVGAWAAGLFHLFTHAFFKALLFLGSGSVIHAVHSNDMREMGGLRKVMPKTYYTWMIGTLALCGVVPFAGFFSKDEILAISFHNGYKWAWVVGVFVAFLTAFYMFRATHMTFHRKYRGHGHPHESPWTMTGPLIFLAIPSALVGFLGLPGKFNIFERWIETTTIEELVHAFPKLHPPEISAETYILGLVSLAVAGLGILVATYVYYWEKTPGDLVDRIAPARHGRTLLHNRYYLDHLYGAIVHAFQYPFAKAAYWTNQYVIDKVLDLSGSATVELGKGTYWVDQKIIDTVYDDAAIGTDRSGNWLKYIQTGRVQQYAAVLFAATALMGIVMLFVK